MSFWGLRMLENPKKSQCPKIVIFLKNIQRGDPWKKKNFSFLFNTLVYCGISMETIRMPFRGLTMLKSPKLIIKGGLCYGFAMVIISGAESWGHSVRGTVTVTQLQCISSSSSQLLRKCV